jgi:hypothetical protein
MTRPERPAFLLAFLLAGTGGIGQAADAPPPLGWYSTSGLGFVMAAGNSRASSLGFKAEAKRLWPKATLSFAAAGVRADASDVARRAVGSPGSFQIETGTRVLKAEKYYALAAFDRRLTDRFAWTAGGEFDRDRFSGIKSRTLGLAGVSYLLANRKDLTLKSGLAATIAHQSEVVPDPSRKGTSAGVRISADAERKFGANSTYVGGLAVDENLQDTADLRVRFGNSLAASMSKRLALQLGVLLVYHHQPSLVALPLFDPAGSPTGLTVAARAATLDTTVTASVVVSFAPRAATP